MISTLSLHSFLLYFISLHQESRKSFQLVAKDDLKQNNKGLGWKLLVLLNLLLCFKLVPGQIFGQLYQRLLELISRMYRVCSLPSRMRRESSIVSMERMSLHCLCERVCLPGGFSDPSHLIFCSFNPNQGLALTVVTSRNKQTAFARQSPLFQTKSLSWQRDLGITALFEYKGTWSGKCCSLLSARSGRRGDGNGDGAPAVKGRWVLVQHLG